MDRHENARATPCRRTPIVERLAEGGTVAAVAAVPGTSPRTNGKAERSTQSLTQKGPGHEPARDFPSWGGARRRRYRLVSASRATLPGRKSAAGSRRRPFGSGSRTSFRGWAYAAPFHNSAERARARTVWLCHRNASMSRLARGNLLGSESWSVTLLG